MWKQINRSIGGLRKNFVGNSLSRRSFISVVATPSQSYNYQDERKFNGSSTSYSSLGILLLGVSLIPLASCDSKASEGKPKPGDVKSAKARWPVISRKEVEKHNSLETGVWVTYLDGVYDVTHFLQNHPGGRERLLGVAGQDIASSWALFAHHKSSPLAQELLQEMKIGVLPPKDVIQPPKNTHVAKYSNKPLYDVIIIGSGLSGLQCGWSLVNEHKIAPEKILVLEAQDYVGGRVKQITEFMKGTKIEVGAEFLHGNNTELTKFAKRNKEPLREIFCWAHGDGGPLDEAVDHGYGLYYIGKSNLNDPKGYRLPKPYKDSDDDVKRNSKNRLLRYDDKDPDFVALNEALWELEHLNENDFDESLSLYDHLLSKKVTTSMLKMGEGGFANTLCANSDELSLKQSIKWSRIWHEPPKPGEDEDGDFTFKNSYSCLIDHLRKDLQIEVNTPVQTIVYDPEADTSDPKTNPVNIVKVITKEGVEYQAKNIVVTASPHVIQNKILTFSPPLPEEIEDAYSWVKMNPIIKVIMKFKRPAWPYHLHGMIMQDDSFLLPEVWFRTVEDEVTPDEPATAYAVGFTTAKYTERLSQYSQEEVLQLCIKQLEQVFSHLEPRHMSENPNDPKNVEALKALPKASEAFLGGMFWDWRPSHHPYIGGGYCSPLVGKPITIGEVLKKGNGKHMFFAGEATNDRPGATAHAALETGIRAANQVAAALTQSK